MDLLVHIGFNVDSLRTFDTNFVIYEDSKDLIMVISY